MILSNDYLQDLIVLVDGLSERTITKILESHLEANRKLESIARLIVDDLSNPSKCTCEMHDVVYYGCRCGEGKNGS